MNVRKWFLLWLCLMDFVQLSIIKVVKDDGRISKSSASLAGGNRQLKIQLYNRTLSNSIHKSSLFFGWKKLYLLLLVPKGLIFQLLTTTTEMPIGSTAIAITEEPEPYYYYYYPYYSTYYNYYDIYPLVNKQPNKRPQRRPNRNQGKRKRVRKRRRRKRRKRKRRRRRRRRKKPMKNHRRRQHRPPWRAVPKGRYSIRKTKRGYNKEGGHDQLTTTATTNDRLTNTRLRPRKYHQKSSIFSVMISSVTFVWRKSLELISSLFDTNRDRTRERAI